MSKSDKNAPPAQQPTLVIHELNAKIFQHRIVLVKAGVADAGVWKPYVEIAYHKAGLFANLESASPLPVGIFRVNQTPSQQME